MSKKKYKMIDLFAGIGGIRLGFDLVFKKNVETVFVSEIDYYAQITYLNNFEDKFDYAGDILEVDETNIPSFDICLAGFPCQPFSIAGKKAGFNDDYYGVKRGNLFLEIIRICKYHRPKVIFCENVKGLVNHDGGRTFKTICEKFQEMGYTVYFQILNSKDFGLAQNRERIYIVCFRNDIESSFFRFPQPLKKKSVLRDILENAPVSSKYYLSTAYLDTLKKHRQRNFEAGNGFGFIIRDLDGVSGALVCGGMGRERNLIVDAREHDLTPLTNIKGEINTENVRKMTPREWARLQGFPEDFVLGLADTHLYKQLGNSVSVNVIAAVAKQIKKVLNENFG